ncbi:uncharacterized protein O3C94_013373 [Discoglossus pictus]
MESANQNRPYYQPWRVEPSHHSKEWNKPLNSAHISSLTTRRPIWSGDMGLLDRETNVLFGKPASHQNYTESNSQWLQPKIRENGGTHYILQHLPPNNSIREDIAFPSLYNYIGSSHHESQFDGVTSSRWIAAGSELIKLDPEPISRSILKSPWNFIHNSSFTTREQACDPGGKMTHLDSFDCPPTLGIRGMEEEIERRHSNMTSVTHKPRGPYRAKMSSNINQYRDEPEFGLVLTAHHDSEYETGKTETYPSLVNGTIDLTDQSPEVKEDSTSSTEENKFLLIDDQGIPYTVSKKDLIRSSSDNPIPEDRSQVSKKLHYCPVCFRTFLYLSDLERHSITHSENKPFECKVCGKSFKRSSHLQRHKHIHTGERPFQCAICMKGFRESGELQRHQRVHTGEKPYQCEVCHLRFTERNTLRRHIKRKHSKEALYQQDTGDSSDWGETLEEMTNEDNTE